MTMHDEVVQFHRRCLRMVELARSRTLSRQELHYLAGSCETVLAAVGLEVRDYCGPACQARSDCCTACGHPGPGGHDGRCLRCQDNGDRAHTWCAS